MRGAGSATYSCYHDILPHLRLNAMDPTDIGLKPLKPQSKLTFPTLNCFSQVFVTATETY
jgi:hypothetical protein